MIFETRRECRSEETVFGLRNFQAEANRPVPGLADKLRPQATRAFSAARKRIASLSFCGWFTVEVELFNWLIIFPEGGTGIFLIKNSLIMDRTKEALNIIRELSDQVTGSREVNNLVRSKPPSLMIELEAGEPDRVAGILSRIREALEGHVGLVPRIRQAVMLISEGFDHPCTVREAVTLHRGLTGAVGSGASLVNQFVHPDRTLNDGLKIRLLLWAD